jgi:hypothetical protein
MLDAEMAKKLRNTNPKACLNIVARAIATHKHKQSYRIDQGDRLQ